MKPNLILIKDQTVVEVIPDCRTFRPWGRPRPWPKNYWFTYWVRHGRPLQPGKITLIGPKYINFQSGDQPGENNKVIATFGAVRILSQPATTK